MAEPVQEDGTRFYGWYNVIFLFIIYAAIMGFVFYGFTVIFPAMINAQGWGRGEAALAHTIRGLLVGFMAPLVAYSIARFGAANTMKLGLAIGAVALALLGTVASELWHWIVLWGFVMPFTFSFGGVIPIQTTVTYWFNARRATAIGIVVTGAAVAGFIAAPVYTRLMDATGTWRSGWLTASVISVIALAVSFMLKNKPEDLGQFPDGLPTDSDGAPTANQKKLKKPKTYRTETGWTLKEALGTPTPYLYMFCLIAQAWALYIVTVHGVLHLTDEGYTRMQAASVIGNLILFSGFARFPAGVLGDRIEPRILSAIALAGMGISLFFFWKAPATLLPLLCVSGVYGFCFGATVVLFPTIVGNYFGPSAFAPITGFVTPFMIVFGAPVPFVAGLIHDRFHNYDAAFIPIVVMVLLSAVCCFIMTPPRKKNMPGSVRPDNG
jgi:MFS transporter, OFA family, oxalate/formate antiporter